MPTTLHLYITPKPALLDAQGRTVESALHGLGFSDVHNVRIGRVITLQVGDAAGDGGAPSISDDEAVALAARMCDTLLANPVTESYRIEVAR